MGGSTTWEQQTNDDDTLASKKRKRDIEDQKSRNSATYRHVNPHSNPRCPSAGKELLPSNKAVCGQSPADYARQASTGPNLRPRLRPVLAKRRRIEHPQDEYRPAPVPRDVTQDELKLYDNSPIDHGPFSPSSEEPPRFTQLLPPASDSPASPHLRSPQKQQPQVQQRNTTTTSPRQNNHRQSQHQHQHHDSDPSTTALNPCHICHRRPTTRSALDGYADCNLCGERTCYICLRECLSPHCRAVLQSRGNTTPGPNDDDNPKTQPRDVDGRKVCSSCAVEGVTEYGEDIVWCLDCVEQDREMETGGL